jgi:hypothetical protein
VRSFSNLFLKRNDIIDLKGSSISKSVAHLLEIRTGFKEVSRHLNTSIGYLKASLTISRILILNLLNGTTVIRVSHSIWAVNNFEWLKQNAAMQILCVKLFVCGHTMPLSRNIPNELISIINWRRNNWELWLVGFVCGGVVFTFGFLAQPIVKWMGSRIRFLPFFFWGGGYVWMMISGIVVVGGWSWVVGRAGLRAPEWTGEELLWL